MTDVETDVNLDGFSQQLPEKKRASFLLKAKGLISNKKFLVVFFSITLILASLSSIVILTLSKSKKPTPSQASVIQKVRNPTPSLPTQQIQLNQVIGFLPSWTLAQGAAIKPENLTQIIYFGLGVTEDGQLIQFTEDGRETNEWKYFKSESFIQVRDEAKASGTKVLLAIKSFNNDTIDRLTSNSIASDRLINSLLTLVERYKLDGVNVDFEYVTDVDFPTVKFFNRFLESLASKLRQKDAELILSVDVNATAVLVDKAYDMVKIGEVADQVILMAYDYHRPESTRAGPVAPIDSLPNEHNIIESLNSLNGRVPSEKIILGIPFYGYEWQTISENNKSPTVENTGALATYKRVRELIEARDDETIVWDDIAKSPWLTYEQSGAIKQIYYEDARSLEEKLKFATGRGLSGIAIWALGYEGDYQEPWQVIVNFVNRNH